jgi:hypothetical protein
MVSRTAAAAVLLCIVHGLTGAAAQAQTQFDRYGFDRPGYNVLVDEPAATAGVFMRYHPGASRRSRDRAEYGAALSFADNRVGHHRISMELRFNGAHPDALWVNGAREQRVVSFNANEREEGAAPAALMGVGALLVSLAAVASNEAENPCVGGYLTATGCVATGS